MDTAALLAQLAEHGPAMADAAERAGLDARVPSCPDWDVRALLDHTGMVHRWASEHVRLGSAAGQPDWQHAPEDGVVAWFHEGHAALVAALTGAPDDLDAMTFLTDAGPARHFWTRRQAHETAIHRADAESAAGRVPAYDPAFAFDGVAELLEGFYGRRGGRLHTDPPFTLRVVPADSDVSWLVSVGPDAREITRGSTAAADCTLIGSSPDLYLTLWNRTPVTAPDIDGDVRVLARWKELARIGWS